MGGRRAPASTGRVFVVRQPGRTPPAFGAEVASGGELSRVALAVKRVLASVDAVPTLVFDEVDAGIGGRTAQAVAQRLQAMAPTRQVHLRHPLGANRDHGRQPSAHEQRRPTTAHDRPCHAFGGQERVEEIARMLAGVLTESTLDHARELLAMAETTKTAS